VTAADNTLEAVELIKAVKSDKQDEVDKILCKNGVLYNSEEDIDYEKNYGDNEGSEDEKDN